MIAAVIIFLLDNVSTKLQIHARYYYNNINNLSVNRQLDTDAVAGLWFETHFYGRGFVFVVKQ